MKEFFVELWEEEEGLEVVEVLLILAVLVGIAIMFKDQITNWATTLFDTIESKLGNF